MIHRLRNTATEDSQGTLVTEPLKYSFVSKNGENVVGSWDLCNRVPQQYGPSFLFVAFLIDTILIGVVGTE